MKILYFSMGEPPKLVTVKKDLGVLQALVGGYLEVLQPWDDNILLVCNDEGKFSFKINRLLLGSIKYDCIYGPFFLCGVDGCEFADFPADLVDKYVELLKKEDEQ